MTTGKDFGLPAEYHDWVINDGKRKVSDFDDYVMVTANRHRGNAVTYIPLAQLFPPKPKPELPDVKPGAVISFRCNAGSVRRAIRSGWGTWRVFERGTPVVYYGTEITDPLATDRELLADVDDDGFTVELDGL